MFSQSCNCLPNKKQSLFSNQSPQNMGFLRSLTSKSYQDSSDNFNIDFQAMKKINNNPNFSSGTKIMDLVNNFAETSRIKFERRYISTFSVPTIRSKLNSKEILTHCNTMTTIPLASSYVVGGFVGSKSQLGRRRKSDVGKLSLWDIVRDLVDLVGNAPANFSGKPNHLSPFDKHCDSMQDSQMQKTSSNQINLIGLNGVEPPCLLKQSYADVAKRPTRNLYSVQIDKQPVEQQECTKSPESSSSVYLIESNNSSCNRTSLSNRDRFPSECSADSEDSFIVFECCDGDDNIDEEIYSSDDDTLSYVEEVSGSDSGIVPSSDSCSCDTTASKKVRFAEGKNLAKVHPMVTWNFAYRMARRGPWEMLARDSERFKLRIIRTEEVLKPILDPQHRSVVFRDRFADSTS